MKVRLITESYRRKIDGVTHFYGKDDVLEVGDDEGARLLRLKAAVDVDAAPDEEPTAEPADDITTSAGASPDDDTEPASTTERPKNAENKEAWVKYYRQVKGQEPAASMTKEDIMAEVG